VFLAWYEKCVDENEELLFNHRLYPHDETVDYMPHFHGAVEIEFVVKGGYDVMINNEWRTVQSGDMVFVDSFDVHKYNYKLGSEFYVVVISPDYFDGVNCLKEITFPHFNSYCKGFDIIKDFLGFSYNNYVEDSLAYKRGFVDMLIGLIRQYYPEARKLERPKNDEIMVDIIKFINENSEKDLGIGEIAERFEYTPNYLSNIFNNFMGMNFRDYLNWVRMTRYTKLKQNAPGIPDTHAYRMCGFNCAQSFYRAKKKYESIKYIPDYR